VILLSDHGFHSDHLRPLRIPNEPVGPVVQHRDHGILVMAGKGLQERRVKLGARNDSDVEIAAGLKEDEVVLDALNAELRRPQSPQ
jgi:hypothetical protein